MDIYCIFLFIITGLEMFLFGGVYLGFNSIIPFLKVSGVFNNSCSHIPSTNQTIVCSEQNILFGQSFLTWILFQAFINTAIGVLLDKFGLKLIKIIGALCSLMGYLCLAFVIEYNWLFFITGCFLSIASHSLICSNASISFIYKKRKNLYLGFNMSMFSCSGIIMTIIGYLLNYGFNFKYIFITYSIISICYILITMYLQQHYLNKPQFKTKEEMESLNKNNIEDIDRLQLDLDNYINNTYKTYKSCLLSKPVLFNFIFLVISRFRFTYFLSQLSLQLNYLFNNNQILINQILMNSNLLFAISIIIGLTFGYSMDKYHNIMKHSLVPKLNRCVIHGKVTGKVTYGQIQFCFFIPVLINTLLLILGSILLLFPYITTFYISIACFTISRSLTMCIYPTFLLSVIPIRFYGLLTSIFMSISNLSTLFQQLLLPLSHPDKYPNIINISLIIFTLLAFIHCAYLVSKRILYRFV